MASPSAFDSGNPLQRMALLSVCSDMQFSRARFSRDANDQRQGFCLLRMLVSNVCRDIFDPLRLTLVCALLDLKREDFAATGSVNLGAG
jgi:hypothetical protein